MMVIFTMLCLIVIMVVVFFSKLNATSDKLSEIEDKLSRLEADKKQEIMQMDTQLNALKKKDNNGKMFSEAESLDSMSPPDYAEEECFGVKLLRMQRNLWIAPNVDCIKVNVQGSVLTVLPDTLTSIRDSALTKLIKGADSLRDNAGYLIIDMDPNIFKQLVNYLDYDRVWEPAEGDAEAVKAAIAEWGLDRGLADPFVLSH